MRWTLAGRTCELRGGSAALRERARSVLLGSSIDGDQAAEPDSLWIVEPAEPGLCWTVTHSTTGESRRCDSIERVVHVVEFQAIGDLVSRHAATTTLHAAVVARAGRGLLVVGPCESGKSTLATLLWLRGWSFLGDDVAVIADAGRGVRAATRRVSLRFGSRPSLGEDVWKRIATAPSFMETAEGCLFHPHEVDGTTPHGEMTPAAIVFLARRGITTGPAELRRIDPAAAILALAPYSNVVRQGGMGAALPRLRPLVEQVPAYDLGRGPLPDMLAVAERLLDSL
jgi:hypothetical protein